MIGFNVSIYRFGDERLRSARGDLSSFLSLLAERTGSEDIPQSQKGDARIAVWQSGYPGWLEALADERVAAGTRRGGFPDTYVFPARFFLERLRLGLLPDANEPWGMGPAVAINWKVWPGRTTIYDDKLAGCDPEEWLLAVAWDED